MSADRNQSNKELDLKVAWCKKYVKCKIKRLTKYRTTPYLRMNNFVIVEHT